MRLTQLNPKCVAGPTVEGHGTATLSFDCPRCGPPHQVSVLVGETNVTEYVWKMTVPTEGDYSNITIEPSINNHYHARMKPCGWHGTIINGEVVGA